MTLGLRAGAPSEPERGCRPAGERARGRGRPGAESRCSRQRHPRAYANRTAARGLGPARRDAAGREAASGWSASRALPLTSRAARPRRARAPGARGPKVPSAAPATESLATGYSHSLSSCNPAGSVFPFLGSLSFSPFPQKALGG